jgi:IS5 family transposase
LSEIDIVKHINDLSHEEERLYASAAGEGGLNAAEMARLDEIKVELDRSYDLLHQRQARQAAGLDPEEAELRTADVVEGYQQ